MKILKFGLMAALLTTVTSVVRADDKPLLQRLTHPSFSWMKQSEKDRNEPPRMIVLTNGAKPIRLAQSSLPPGIPPAPAADDSDVIYSSPESAPLQPVPMPQEYQEYHEPMQSHSHVPAPNVVPLYDCVKYEDRHNIHPCAITKVIAVLDPRDPACKRGGLFSGFGHHHGHGQCNECGCNTQACGCGKRYVYIQICVPPCECVNVKVSRDESKVKYDYGKYEVEIKSKDGVVYVDYDD